MVYLPKAIANIKKNNQLNVVDKKFLERMQLAVTEVNGCPACSYQHTKMALRLGMSNEEISSFLSGGDQFIKPEEAKAIMFAQHFADSRGFPKKYAYDAIVTEYGEEQAAIMLSALQIMIAGNMYLIPLSAFQSRMKGHIYPGSSLFFELGMLIAGIVFIPFVAIHGLLRGLLGLPASRLDKSATDD